MNCLLLTMHFKEDKM